jgi:pimeloyl-ACP methyl ester carboxylesterase
MKTARRQGHTGDCHGVSRRGAAVAGIVATCAVLLIGSGAAMAGKPASVLAHRDVSTRIAWKGCGKRLQCARVRVPLDWGRPRLGTISLAVARHLASRPRQRIGSLFVDYGGPGVAGAPIVKAAGAELDRLGDGRFDVIGWDPRGTGASTHVRCFADARAEAQFWGRDWSTPTTRAESERYLPKAVGFVKRCVARSRRLIMHDSTADTVRDLDYLRKLVGDRKLNYRGLSYGSFIGETYANMFPHRVRAMILDGVIDPVPYVRSTQAGIASTTGDFGRVFHRMQSLCQDAGPSRCALAGHGSVGARVRRVVAMLRHRPIPAPSAVAPHRLTYGDLLFYLFGNLGRPASWPVIAAGLEHAYEGDGSAIEAAVDKIRPFYRNALNSATALQCADKPRQPVGPGGWPTIIGRLTRINPVLGVTGWWLAVPCAAWPVVNADRYAGPWKRSTPNPVLLLGTRYDPQTAYAGARRAAALLGNARLLTLDGYGHTSDVDPSRCVDRRVTAYLTRLASPPRGAVCRPDRQPFDPEYGKAVPHPPGE